VAEKFLILGGNSFYGKNFAELVKYKGGEVDLFYRPAFDLNNGKGWNFLQAALGTADYVVNFISKSLVVESWANPEEWVRTNALSTTGLFKFLQHFGVKKYVHVSTPEVYGSIDGWVTEEQPFNPSTPYAVSRAAGDMMLKAFYNAYNFPVVITRTANIYGPGQPDHRIVTRAIGCKKRGDTLMLDGAGNSIRCFIHVKDACEATYLAATKGKIGETYHISGWNPLSIRQLVETIGCKWVRAPERLGKDYAYMLDSTKIRKLGWQDKINLIEGLAECELSILA
jgi:dTDP-glucose 4,6-dehydratase